MTNPPLPDNFTPDRFQWTLDERGKIWVVHVCNGEIQAWRVPPPWSLVNGLPSPSFDCTACGVHHFVNEGDRCSLWHLERALAMRGQGVPCTSTPEEPS